MKRTRGFVVAGLCAVLAATLSATSMADPMLTVVSTGSDIGLEVLATAQFTVDDWLSNPNMWVVSITNTATSESDSIKYAEIDVNFSTTSFADIITGTMTIISVPRTKTRPGVSYTYQHESSALSLEPLMEGGTMVFNNTMVQGTGSFSGSWDTDFQNEVLRTGTLPEGLYELTFTLEGEYMNGVQFGGSGDISRSFTFEMRNAQPPELISPEDMAENAVRVPRFAWQRPLVSDFRDLGTVKIKYILKVWRMFDDTGSMLTEEDAINRIPIWTWESDPDRPFQESRVFDPGTAREELMSGRMYCWQVQALDGYNRPVSPTNEGKSDIFQFTVQFTPPDINEPLNFFPLSFNWSAARAGGGQVLYRVSIADNSEYTGAYLTTNIAMTSFTYPSDAPRLRLGTTYYIRLQTTDETGMPIGVPDEVSFTLPVTEVSLRTPADGVVLSTLTPRFSWQGTASHYIVMVFDAAGEWSYISRAIAGRTWVYDGDELTPGQSYSWNVTAANELGDPVGNSSNTRTFTLTSDDQVIVVSPANEEVSSLTPTFTWRAVEPPTGQGTVQYNISITDADGGEVHSATVTTTSYTYPSDATPLRGASRYAWSVNARQGNTELATSSEPAMFTTPLASGDSSAATMAEINQLIQSLLADYPALAEFSEKTLVSIIAPEGSLTPSAFIELFDTYSVVSVSRK